MSLFVEELSSVKLYQVPVAGTCTAGSLGVILNLKSRRNELKSRRNVCGYSHLKSRRNQYRFPVISHLY
jgi:hypothetical protein